MKRLSFVSDKTIKLWKVSERDKKVEGYNTKEEAGQMRDPACVTQLRVSHRLLIPFGQIFLKIFSQVETICSYYLSKRSFLTFLSICPLFFVNVCLCYVFSVIFSSLFFFDNLGPIREL